MSPDTGNPFEDIGMPFDEAVALKAEIERDPCYHVTSLQEMHFPVNSNKWRLYVVYQLIENGKRRYHKVSTTIRCPEDFARFQETTAIRVQVRAEQARRQRKPE